MPEHSFADFVSTPRSEPMPKRVPQCYVCASPATPVKRAMGTRYLCSICRTYAETPYQGEWTKLAACRLYDDPKKQAEVSSWFFDGAVGKAPEKARRICADCPVQQECLDYALEIPSLEGIWGGTTERERQRLRKLKKSA